MEVGVTADAEDTSVIKLSPPRASNMAKTPSVVIPRIAVNEPPQLTPLERVVANNSAARTPNITSGASSQKIKDLQVEERKMSTAQVPPLEPTLLATSGASQPNSAGLGLEASSIIEVNEQIDQIDYNMSNDGMSASFYRHHDQWLAMQSLQEK